MSKLSEILYTCDDDDITSKAYISMIITIVDAMQAPMAIKNFGPFFKDQIKHCYAILLTHIEDEKQVEKAKQLIVELAPHTPIYTDVDALQQDIHQLKSNTHKAHEHDSETCSCHTCNDSEDTTVLTTTITVIMAMTATIMSHQPFVSYTFHNLQTLTHTQWIDFCNKLPSTVLRVKRYRSYHFRTYGITIHPPILFSYRYALKGLPPSCYWHRYRHFIHTGESV